MGANPLMIGFCVADADPPDQVDQRPIIDNR